MEEREEERKVERVKINNNLIKMHSVVFGQDLIQIVKYQ